MTERTLTPTDYATLMATAPERVRKEEAFEYTAEARAWNATAPAAKPTPSPRSVLFARAEKARRN